MFEVVIGKKTLHYGLQYCSGRRDDFSDIALVLLIDIGVGRRDARVRRSRAIDIRHRANLVGPLFNYSLEAQGVDVKACGRMVRYGLLD